jgi:hypothetical protein
VGGSAPSDDDGADAGAKPSETLFGTVAPA